MLALKIVIITIFGLVGLAFRVGKKLIQTQPEHIIQSNPIQICSDLIELCQKVGLSSDGSDSS